MEIYIKILISKFKTLKINQMKKKKKLMNMNIILLKVKIYKKKIVQAQLNSIVYNNI